MPNQGLKEAATKLQNIIAQVNDSITDERRAEISQELMTFLAELPWDPEYSKIREIGDAIFNDLERAITRNSLARIRSRSNELATHIGTVSAIASRAEADAKTLRLESIKLVVNATTEAVNAIKAVKTSIEAGELEEATEKLDSLVATLLKLQSDVAKAT